ncbi:MAG: hypothetical protein AB8B61_07815 [Cyclobacteriaceae bacterium]
MKKHIFSISMLLAFATVVIAQNSERKVAIVSIYSDKYIGSGDFGAGIQQALSLLSGDSLFNLKPISEKFKDKFINDYAEQLPFTILDEKLVIENEEYKNYQDFNADVDSYKDTDKSGVKNFVLDHMKVEVPQGYKYIPNVLGKGKKNKAINDMKTIFADNADAVASAWLSFELEKKIQMAGFGIGFVKTYLWFRVYDRLTDKVIFKFKEAAKSKKTFKFALGGAALQASKIQPLCEEAVERLYVDLDKELPRRIKQYLKKTK